MLRIKAALILLLVSAAIGASAQESGQVHVVLPGENLFRISEQYGVSVDAIAKANNITNTWRIYAGESLVIPDLNATPTPPAPSSDTSQPAPATSTPQPTQTVTIGFGQNLGALAQKYGMTVNEVAELNHITNPDLIYAGQHILVYSQPSSDTTAPSANPPPVSAPVTHIVQAGETLASIGQQYGISWLDIAQANHIYDADHIAAGQEILIPAGGTLNSADNNTPPAPAARIGQGKEIIVDLSQERVYAYEDGKLVRNDLVSTGLPGSPTVQGSFKIQRKYVAQTMTGPGYYLPAVPYVMYFYAGYALHGTYWHNNFGHPMSHGCVNLPTPEAEWFYGWADVGTPVYVQA